ncbi:NUDIX hydrolase [Candidatus Dojkabacteria bacterium]|nr:NUDIX hydrolase [Candidatus Dojkabacteria bacterium]
MDKKYFRIFALALFLDKEENIVIQDRRTHSKAGEKYGIFGGGVEEGESSVEGLKRELFEELGYSVVDPKLWKTKEIQIEGHGLGIFHYFIVPISHGVAFNEVKEGAAIKMKLDQLLTLEGLEPEDKEVFEEVKRAWDDIKLML